MSAEVVPVDGEADAQAFRERLATAIGKVAPAGVAAFARLSGIPDPTIRGWLRGPYEPKRPDMVRLASSLGVSLRWLAAGLGDMDSGAAAELPWSNDVMVVPLYPAELSAGDGREVWEHMEPRELLRLPRSLVQAHMGCRSRVIALKVRGDSMEPTIRDGATVLLDANVRRISRDGMIYAIRTGDNLLIKRAFLIPQRGVRLVGDNRVTSEVILNGEEAGGLDVLGRIGLVINPV